MTINRLKKFALVGAVVTFGIVDTVPVGASADPSSTTSSTDSPTTTEATSTTSENGSTSTTVGNATTTTTPAASPTSTLPSEIRTGFTPLDQTPPTTIPATPTAPAATPVAAKDGPDLLVSGQVTGPAVPGYPVVGKISVSNVGNQLAGDKAPVKFRLAEAPTWAKLRDVLPALAADSAVGTVAWQCSTVDCTLVEKQATGVVNATLAPGRAFGAYLRYDLDKAAVIPPPKKELLQNVQNASAAGDVAAMQKELESPPHINAVASLSGDTSGINDTAILQLFGAETQPVAGAFFDGNISATVYPGGVYRAEMRVLVLGSVVQSGDITLAEVVPAALKLQSIKVSGNGWKCDSDTSPNICTHTGPNRNPGEFSDALIIEGRVGTDVTPSETPLTWKIPMTAKPATGTELVQGNGSPSVLINKVPAPDMSVRMTPRDGNSSLVPGKPVTLDVGVRSGNGLGQAVVANVQVQKGLTIQGPATDSDPNWQCTKPEKGSGESEFGDALTCSIAQIDISEEPKLGVTVGLGDGAEDGSARIVATVAASNEAAERAANNSATHSVIVQPQPAPMPGIVLTRPDAKGVTAAVTDGSATEITINKETSYGIAVSNLGSKAMDPGTVLRVEQYVSDYADFSGSAFSGATSYAGALDGKSIATKPGKWVCVTGTATPPAVNLPSQVAAVTDAVSPTTSAPAVAKAGPAIRCELALAAALAPSAQSPVLNLTVKPSLKAKVGKPEWPIYAMVPANPKVPVARYGMTMSLIEYKPEVRAAIIAPAGPRPGGDAVATFSVRNDGNADSSNQYLIVRADNGRVSGAKGDGWKCALVGSAFLAGYVMCSRDSVLKQGEESPAITVDYYSTSKTAKSVTLTGTSVVSTITGTTTRVSKLDVPLRAALSFTIKGPDVIVDQIVDASGKRAPSSILLTTAGNSDGSTFAWRQLCTTQADVAASNGECKSVAPAAKWAGGAPSTGPAATLLSPTVTAETALLFEATATDGSGSSATARTSVRVQPLPTATGPTGKKSSGSGSSVLRRVPKQASASARAFSATAPTSGTGDTDVTTTADTGVTVNGNVFGGSTLTVAQGAAVSLSATAGGVGAISYAWSQASGPSPSVLASATTNTSTVSFTAPSANVTLSLRVVATDARGQKGSDIVTVVVGTGGTATVSATITEGDSPIGVDTAKALTLNASATGSGAITYSWTQVSGPTLSLSGATTSALSIAASAAVGTAVIAVTATDAAGASATDQITLQMSPSGAPTPLCDFVEAISSKTLSKLDATINSIGLGSLNLSQFAVDSGTCSEKSKVSFDNAGFSLAGYLTVSGASGTISAAGLTIRSATITGPESWGSPAFSIGASDPVGLFIPFSRASVAIGAFEGKIESGTMPFLKLPGGWTPSATLIFSVDAEGGKAISLSATATGPAKDGKSPTATIAGAIATNGTFSLDASLTNGFELFGSTIDFSGSVKKETADGDVAVSLKGSLQGEIALASNVKLTALAASYDKGGAISGSGTMIVGSGDTALSVSADLAYTDALNYSMNVTATTAGGVWSPGKDITIPLKSASGSYAVTAGAKDMNITVVGGDVAPFSGLKFVAPTIAATAKCPATGTCDIKVNLDSGAEITLGGSSTTGKISGAIDITNKSASLKASIDKIPLVAGLDINSVSLSVESTNIGAANAATVVTLGGSITLFEKTVTASATFSKSGVLLTADLPELAPFGASGPVWKPGQLAWSSGPISFTPKVPSLPNFKSVNLTAKVPRLDVAIALPDQIKGLGSATVANVGDIALDGEVDFSTGKFSLAASLSNDTVDLAGAISREKTGDPYKYNLTGKVKKPIALTDSVSITTLDVKFGNDTAGGPVTFSGNGSVDIKLPDGTVVSVAGAVVYNSATDFTVNVSAGAASTSFDVAGGDKLSLGQVSGSFKRTATGSVLNVALSTAGPWSPVSGVSVTNVAATASVTCNTGAKCAPAFDIKGTLGFDLGISGLSSADLSGKLDDKGFSFSAKFNDLSFNADIKLLAPTFSLTIPAKASGNKPSATLSGTFSLFKANVNAALTFSSAGVLLTGDFPKFNLPGSDIGFDGGQFAWALKVPAGITGINWTPKVPNFPTLPAVNLPAGMPKLALSMPLPDAVKQLSGSQSLTFGAVKVEGSMTLATGAFSLSASYSSDATELSGAFSREGTGKDLTYTITAKVKQPLTVVDGVKVTSLDLKLSNASGSVQASGTGDIEISTPSTPIVLGFALDYKSSTDYTFSVSVKPTGGTTTWSPFSGLNLPLGNLTGSMSRKDATRTFSLTFKSTADWYPVGSASGPGVQIREPGASITATCQVGASCALAFMATGKVSVSVGQGYTTPATLTGTFTKDKSELKAVFADISVTSGVTIKAPTLAVAYDNVKSALSASISGSADVLGTTLTMGAVFSAQGVIVSGGLNDWTPIPGGPTLTNASFAFSTYPAMGVILPTAPALGKVDILSNNPTLLAGFKVPGWLKSMVSQPSLDVVPVTVPLKDLASGKLPTLRIMLPMPSTWYVFKTSSLSMRFKSIGVEIGGSPTPSLSLIGNILFETGNGASPIPLEVRGTVSTTAISIALSLGLDEVTGLPYKWTNAFGISGLTLSDVAIQLGINFATTPIPLPTLGLAATAELPSSWRSPLGMDAGVAIRLMANIDVTKPCFQFKAGTLGADGRTISAGTAKVINVGGGVLTSTFMDLTIAPLGCQVGNQILDPGISVGFVGTVLGTPVDVRAKIGTSPFSLDASLSIGAFKAGPVQLDQTTLQVKVSPTDNFVAFSGGVTVGSTSVKVSGKVGINTSDGPYIDMTGSIDNLIIVPSIVEIRSARLDMSIKPAKGTATVKASGDFTFLGSATKIDVALVMANYQLQSLSADIYAKRTIASVVTIEGNFSLRYNKGQAPVIAFDATGSVAGYNFGRVTGRIDGNQVAITGTVAIGGVFTAQISGQVVWQAAAGVTIPNRQGQAVAAAAGDFRFAATNISINLGGFAASGSVVIGRAQSLVYADFSASFNIGSGDIGGSLSVAGSFGSDGNFSFTGTGNLNLVGFTANVSVSGSKNGSNWAFSLNTTISVMGAVNVAFSGNFYSSNGGMRFTVSGSAALNAAGLGGLSGQFRFSNEPGQAGMYVALTANIAGVIKGSGSLWVGGDGTFETNIDVGLSLPGVSAGAKLKLGNFTTSARMGTRTEKFCFFRCIDIQVPYVIETVRTKVGTYMTLDGWANVLGFNFDVDGNINSDGSFKFVVSASASWSTGFSIGIGEFRFGADFSASLTVTSYSPYVAVSVWGEAYGESRWISCWWVSKWWGGYPECGYGGWGSRVSIGLGISTNPFSIKVRILGYDFNIR